MLISIEFPMAVEGRPHRAVNTKTILCKDVLEFEISEFSADEMTPAIEVSGDFGRGIRNARYDEYGGRFYLPVDDFDLDDTSFPYAYLGRNQRLSPFLVPAGIHVDDALFEADQAGRTKIHPPEVGKAFSRTQDLDAAVAVPMVGAVGGQMHDKGVALQRDRFRLHMERFILVDGRLMRSEPEPVLVVRVDGYNGEVEIRPMRREAVDKYSVSDSFTSDGIPATYFRIDRVEEAREYAALLCGAYSSRWGRDHFIDKVAAVAVGTPEALTFDGPAVTGLSMARWIQHRFRYNVGFPYEQALGEAVWFSNDERVDPRVAEVLDKLRKSAGTGNGNRARRVRKSGSGDARSALAAYGRVRGRDRPRTLDGRTRRRPFRETTSSQRRNLESRHDGRFLSPSHCGLKD